MRILICLCVVVLLFGSVGFCPPLPDDPELDKPVTLGVKGGSLEDVMVLVEKQTGTKFKAHSDVADHKITIFVDSKPIKVVMNGITTLFGYQWAKKTVGDRTVYEVFQGMAARAERENELKRAYQIAWERLSADLSFKIGISSKSRNEIESIRAGFEKQIETNPSREAYAKMFGAKSLLEDPYLIACLQACQYLPPKWMDMLLEGGEFRLDSESTDPEFRLPDAIKGRLLYSYLATHQTSEESEPAAPEGFSIRYSIKSDTIAIRAEAYVEMQTSSRRIGVTQVHLGSWGMYSTYDDPKDNLPHEAPGDMLARKLTITKADVLRETNLDFQTDDTPRPLASRADLLALLHEKLGLPVIADYYTEWSWQPELKDVTAIDLLGTLPGRLPYSTWGWDGTILYVRARLPLSAAAKEIPNRLIRGWKAVIRKQGGLGLDELAEIASLTSEQRSLLAAYSKHLGFGEHIIAVTPSIGLRVWALITRDQRKAALSGGLRADALSPEQFAELCRLIESPDAESPNPDAPHEPALIEVQPDWRVTVNAQRGDAPYVPVLIEVQQGTVEEQLYYQIIRESGQVVRVEAKSREEAIRKGTDMQLDFRKAVSVRVRRIPYKLLITYSNGRTSSEFCANVTSVVE